jgi:RNA polymerase sigma-70 factor (sigma-E family)
LNAGRRNATGVRVVDPNVSTGDSEEFEIFVAEVSPVLLRAAYLLLRDPNEAQDAVQSTLLRVLRHWANARAAPEAYTQTVLVNVCRDLWKHNRRHPTEPVEAPDRGPSATAIASLEVVEQRELLKEALERLPALQREVLVMRFFLDLPVARAAELLGVPEGTVKSATSRGLEHLRAFLEPTDQEVTNHAELATER